MINTNYKTYIIFAFLLSTISCVSQERNHLTLSEFHNILVDGVKWIDIYETKGDLTKMRTLFRESINYKTGNEPDPRISFWDKGYYFSFADLSGNGNYDLVRFSIDNNLSNITIKGKTITIGDDISSLGNIKLNTYNDGTKGAIFIAEGSDSSGLFIKYSSVTNKITEIEFIEFD